MTGRERIEIFRTCMEHKTIAYWSGLGGVEIRHIDHDIDDYIYCVDSAWTGKTRPTNCHRVKIRTDKNGDQFFMLRSYKIYLNECLRTNI